MSSCVNNTSSSTPSKSFDDVFNITTIYHFIGWIFDNKLKDTEIALQLYKLQADLYPDNKVSYMSIFNIAHIIRFEDKPKSIELFKSIADQDVDAVWMLGVLTKYDNPLEAIEWFKKGEQRGDAQCIHELGDIYYNGTGSCVKDNSVITQDYEKSLSYHLKAAEMGYHKSMLSMSYYYRLGRGVPRNVYKEAEWILKIPNDKLSNVDKFNLGLYYLRNCYNNTDNLKGYEIMKDLVDRTGDIDAMYMLGECYYVGHGVEVNKDTAYLWFSKSADAGDYDGCIKMVELCVDQVDKLNYLKRAMDIRINDNAWVKRHIEFYPKNKKIYIEIGVIELLVKELNDTQEELNEYLLRPPLIGGSLFREARERFRVTGNLNK